MITLLSAPQSRHGAVDRLDVALDDAQVARLERADVDHHVDFARAVEDRPPRLVALDVGASSRPAETRRPSRRRRRCPAAASRRRRHPGRVDADGGEPELRRLAAQLLDVLPRRVGLEQRVIDHRRDVRPARRRRRARRRASRRRRARRAAGRDSSRRRTEWQRSSRRGRPVAAASSPTIMSMHDRMQLDQRVIAASRPHRLSRQLRSASSALQIPNLRQPPDVARLAHRRRSARSRRSPAPRPASRSVAPSVSTLAPLCSRE